MPLAYTRPKPPLPSFQTSRLPLRPWIRSVWILLASTSTRETLPPNVQQTGPDFLLSLRCCPPTSLPRQLPPRTTRHVRFAHSTVSRHRPGLYPPLESPSPRFHTPRARTRTSPTCTHPNSSHRPRATRCHTTSTTAPRRQCPPAPASTPTPRATLPSSRRHPPGRVPRSKDTATLDAHRTLCPPSSPPEELASTADSPLRAAHMRPRREARQPRHPNM